MGVRVTVSSWSKAVAEDQDHPHMYEEAHTWGLASAGDRVFLEIIGKDDDDEDRVLAMFSEFDRVEVVDE